MCRDHEEAVSESSSVVLVKLIPQDANEAVFRCHFAVDDGKGEVAALRLR